jgi:hypothetical protein
MPDADSGRRAVGTDGESEARVRSQKPRSPEAQKPESGRLEEVSCEADDGGGRSQATSDATETNYREDDAFNAKSK